MINILPFRIFLYYSTGIIICQDFFIEKRYIFSDFQKAITKQEILHKNKSALLDKSGKICYTEINSEIFYLKFNMKGSISNGNV